MAEPRPRARPMSASESAGRRDSTWSRGASPVGRPAARRSGGRSSGRDETVAPGHDRAARRRARPRSRTSRAPARRCSPAPSPASSTSTWRASRARPTCCRPTSPAPACSSPAGLRFVAGPGVHEPAPRRRDQPGDAAHAVARCSRRCRSARSRVEGTTRPLPGPVPRARDPEPRRVRGHVRAARRRSSTGSCSARASATPTPHGERRIARRHQAAADPLDAIEPVIDRERLLGRRATGVRTIRVADEVEALPRRRSSGRPAAHPDIELGASPRATRRPYRAAQAAAVLEGRDVRDARRREGASRPAVLAHRLVVDLDRSSTARRADGAARRDPRHDRRPAVLAG